jgi:hypothetical protein
MIDQIKQEILKEKKNEKTLTENGAVSFRTSGKDLVDLNFKAASYRSKTEEELYKDFTKAFAEDQNLAIKWLFFARDIREGLGERKLFRTIFQYLLIDKEWGGRFERLLAAIPEFGRYDDMISLIGYGNNSDDWIFRHLQERIALDTQLMLEKKPISLCAKWMPSEGATCKKRKMLARIMAQKWGISSRDYRKLINKLKAYLDITEVKTSSNRWGEINYSAVPSRANLKYRTAFYKHDHERYEGFLNSVKKGEAKINSGVNFPHDIVYKYTNGVNAWRNRGLKYDEAIEQLWKALPHYDLSNTLVVADGSGSMTMPIGSSGASALDVAISLAIYCSEKNQGVYRNKYITFSDNPQYVEFDEDDSLCEKIKIAVSHNEVASTNIQKVFEIILNTAINNKLTQDEIVKNILIISDMEFNEATGPYSKDVLFQHIAKLYKDANYKLPKLIFWNVNSRTNAVPIQENENGVALVSGFSPHILKMVTSDNLDPYGILVENLLSKRYENVYWGS